MRLTKPPIRDPQTPGYVQATMLQDGTVPPIDSVGNFIVGPTRPRVDKSRLAQPKIEGRICEFSMSSDDSQIYPGIARKKGTFGTPDPNNSASLVVTTSFPRPWPRLVTVYIPKQFQVRTVSPFVVGTDGPDPLLFEALDGLLNAGKIPPTIGISIGNGGGDAQGSQRGLEYDTLSGLYAQFVEEEVLPRVEEISDVLLTKNPHERIAMGCSSGAACALNMAWFRTDLYRRVISFSGTYVNQQWPHDPELPGGAWEFHDSIIPGAPQKPLCMWLAVADRDLYNDNVMRDGMHDWVLANQRMAHVLLAKEYTYQFNFVRNARHCDPSMRSYLLPQALEWIHRNDNNVNNDG